MGTACFFTVQQRLDSSGQGIRLVSADRVLVQSVPAEIVRQQHVTIYDGPLPEALTRKIHRGLGTQRPAPTSTMRGSKSRLYPASKRAHTLENAKMGFSG